MSYADVSARIGTIEANLARFTGNATATSPVQSPARASPAGTISVAMASTALAPSTAGAEFTKVLNTVLSPATVASAAPADPVSEHSPATGRTEKPPVANLGEPEPNRAGTDGTDVVAQSKKYLGIPYVWGGNNPAIGLDCSSFVQHTFRDLGIELPRVARQQAKEGTEVPTLAQAKPGDLIVTRGGGHIGIYLGDNKMIHAPRPGETVSIRELFEKDADIMTIRRIVPAASVPAADVAAQRAAFENLAAGGA